MTEIDRLTKLFRQSPLLLDIGGLQKLCTLLLEDRGEDRANLSVPCCGFVESVILTTGEVAIRFNDRMPEERSRVQVRVLLDSMPGYVPTGS